MKDISQSFLINSVLMQCILDLVVFFMSIWIYSNFSSMHYITAWALWWPHWWIKPEYLDGKSSQGSTVITNVIQFGDKCPLYGSRESQAKTFLKVLLFIFLWGTKSMCYFSISDCYIKMSWHMCLKCKIYKKEKKST